jgi:hypothetical protein
VTGGAKGRASLFCGALWLSVAQYVRNGSAEFGSAPNTLLGTVCVSATTAASAMQPTSCLASREICTGRSSRSISTLAAARQQRQPPPPASPRRQLHAQAAPRGQQPQWRVDGMSLTKSTAEPSSKSGPRGGGGRNGSGICGAGWGGCGRRRDGSGIGGIRQSPPHTFITLAHAQGMHGCTQASQHAGESCLAARGRRIGTHTPTHCSGPIQEKCYDAARSHKSIICVAIASSVLSPPTAFLRTCWQFPATPPRAG